MIKFEIFNIFFFYIRKTIQLSMIRIYEEKRDISKHRKLKKKKTPHFFGITIKKGKPRKTKVPSGDAHGKYDFFLGE